MLFLSKKITYNEPGAVSMRKAAIIDLETSIRISKTNLYQQMREALFLKSVISNDLAELYHRRDKPEQFSEYSKISESCAKEFNNIDQFVESSRALKLI